MGKFDLTAQLQLQQPRNVDQIANQIRRQLGDINTTVKVRTNTRAIKEASSAIGLINTEAINATKSTSELGKTLGLAARRFGAISIATGTFLALVRGIKRATSEAIEFERELNKIKQATDGTSVAIREVGDRVTELSTKLGVSSKELVEASRVLAQAGFSAKTAAGALKILAQTDLAATFDSIQDTTEGAIALLQQFGREAIKSGKEVEFLEKSLSAINSVSKAYAVESADIIAAIRKTGGSFEAAGGNLNELIALFTSVRATTRESADTIATAFRTIFTRIQRTDTVDALRELGVELQDVNGKFVGPLKAIENLSVALSVLDSKDFRFTQIVEELGGIRQIGKVIPLIKQYAITHEALAVAEQSSGSLAKDAATAQESLAVQIAKVKEEFSALVREFVGGYAFKSMIAGALALARALIKVADAIQPIIPLIVGLAGAKLGQGLVSAFGSFAGLNKRHQGGVIRRFASGGVVPGSGNGDTVPAMLTPGEFVIKKSSVQKIGADKLHRLNAQRFAVGGRVGQVKENLKARSKRGGIIDQDRVGALVFEPESKVKANRKENVIEVQSSDFDTKDSNGNVVHYSKMFPGFHKNYQLIRSGVDESLENTLHENIRASLVDGLATAVNRTGKAIKAIAPNIKINENLVDEKYKNRFANAVGSDTVGKMFETLVTSMSDPTFSKSAEGNRPFDFIGKVAHAEKLFDGATRGIKYRDAKITTNSASVANFKGKIVSQAIRELAGNANKQPTVAPVVGKKYIGKAVNALLGLPTNGSGITHEKRLAKAAAAGYTLIGNNDTPVPGQMQFKAKSLGVDKAGASKGYEYEFFARGGSAKGTDTVPAMLTPGEFVINKKAAQKIGYSKLGKLNKTGKTQYLAKGGVAGGDSERIDYSLKLPGDDMRETFKSFNEFRKYTIELSKSIGVAVKGVAKLSDALKAKGFRGFAKSGVVHGDARLTTKDTVAHELGHIADVNLGSKIGVGKLASETKGTLQNALVEQYRPIVAAQVAKMSEAQRNKQVTSGGKTQSYEQYALSDAEVFAKFFAVQNKELQKKLATQIGFEGGFEHLAPPKVQQEEKASVNPHSVVEPMRPKKGPSPAKAAKIEETERRKYIKNVYKEQQAKANEKVIPGQDADTTKKLYNLGGQQFIDKAIKFNKPVKMDKGSPGDYFVDIRSKLEGYGATVEATDRAMEFFHKKIKEGVPEQDALNKAVQLLTIEERKAAKTAQQKSAEFAQSKGIKIAGVAKSGGPPKGPNIPAGAAAGGGGLPGGPPNNNKTKVKSTTTTEDTTNQVVNTGSHLAQNFLLIGGLLTSTAGQLGLFEGALADSVTQGLAMSTALYGIGSTLLEAAAQTKLFTASSKVAATANVAEAAASNASAAADNVEAVASTRAAGANVGMTKGLGIAQGALLGFAVGMGVLQAIIAGTEQQKDKANKSADEELKKTRETGKGDLSKITSDLMKASKLEAKAKEQSFRGTGGVIAGAGAGATIGAYLGSALGPLGTAVGLGVGGIAGGVVGAVSAGSTATDKAAKTDASVAAVEYSAKAQYTAAKAAYDFATAMDQARQKNLKGGAAIDFYAKEVGKLQKESTAAEIASRNAEMKRNTAAVGRVSSFGALLGYQPEFTDQETKQADAEKAQIAEAQKMRKEGTTALGGAIDQSVSDFLSAAKASVTLEEALKGSGADKGLKAFREALIKNGEDEAKVDSIIKQRMALYSKEVQQANQNLNVQSALIAAKEAEINLALKTNAALNSLVQTSRDFESVQNNLTRTIGVAEGSFKSIPTNFAAAFADITKVGNKDEFKGLANQAASVLGPGGQQIADQVVAMSDSISKLRQGLSEETLKNLKDKTGGLKSDVGRAEIDTLLKKILGDSDLAKLGPDLKKKIIASIQERASKGEINGATIQEIIDDIAKSSQGQLELLKQAGQAANDYLAQYERASEAIISGMNREAALRANLVGIEQKGVDRLTQVFSDKLSEFDSEVLFAQKDVRRTAAAQAALGPDLSNVQAGNVKSIAGALSGNRSKIAANQRTLQENNIDVKERAKLEDEQRKLVDSTHKLTAELTRLTDQSDKAADIMEQIGKERAKREFVKGEARNFVLGSQEERFNQASVYQGANVVAQTGTFQTLPEDLRRSVGDLLDQIAELQPGGYADQVRKNAYTNDFMRMGFDRQTAQGLAQNAGTSKEEKLINDLRALNEQEKAAQNALIAAEIENTKSIADLIPSINALVDVISNNFAGQGKATGLRRGGVVYASKGMFTPKGTDTVPAMLTPGEFVVNKKAVDKYGKGFLSSVNNGSLSSKKAIYRARGGLTRSEIESAMMDPNNTLSRADLEAIGPDRKGPYETPMEVDAKKAAEKARIQAEGMRKVQERAKAKEDMETWKSLGIRVPEYKGRTARELRERRQARVENERSSREAERAELNKKAAGLGHNYARDSIRGNFLQNRYGVGVPSAGPRTQSAQVRAQQVNGGVAYNQAGNPIQAPMFSPSPQANGNANISGMFDNLVSGMPKAINDGLSDLVKTLTSLTQTFNGMHMTHEINVSGQVNVAGLNDNRIAEAIRDTLTDHVMYVVKKELDKNKNSLRAG